MSRMEAKDARDDRKGVLKECFAPPLPHTHIHTKEERLW